MIYALLSEYKSM
jgi:hypothetical protein